MSIFDGLKSIENDAVTRSDFPRGRDHGVHSDAREETQIADLDSVVANKRPENIGVLG